MDEKKTIWSYLEPFLYSREHIHLADVSKRMGRPHSTVRKHLNLLERRGILTKSIKGRLTLYRLNPSSPCLVDYLVLAEKEKLISKSRRDLVIKELVSLLHDNLDEGSKALIFGSAIGDARKANDIDILATGKIGFGDKIKEFEKRFGVKIHLINVKNLKAVTPGLKAEIMKKHLIVQGSEEVVRWLA
jgi:DNA-binding transcriptional ArsR family regulator